MTPSLRSTLFLALAALPLSAGSLVPTRPSPVLQEQADIHQPRADRWLKRNGFDVNSPPALEPLLARGFAHLPIGIYDIMILPSALADSQRLGDVQEAVLALLDAQLEWISWIPATDGLRSAPASLQSDAKTVQKWIEKWKASSFQDPEAVRAADLFELAKANAKTRKAAQLLTEYMLSGGPVAELATPRKPAGLILIPTREDFVEFLSTVGLVELRHRPFFWIAGTTVWTQFNFDGNRVVALEFAKNTSESEYVDSIPMDFKNPKTLAEQVAQLGSRSLIEATVGQSMDSLLVGGLANDIVISIFGEVDTRTDGDTTGKSTDAVGFFVAGGNPTGGNVATSAESRWRVKQGSDRFLDLLVRAQKDASRSISEKWAKPAGFQLVTEDGSAQFTVSAPFFGPGATSNPPDEFAGDYKEFLRAYRVAFLHWLRTASLGNKKKCQEGFARFMRSLTLGTGLSEALLEIYESPLSAESTRALMEADPSSLEERFLMWLTKQ